MKTHSLVGSDTELYNPSVHTLTLRYDLEDDGRIIAEVGELPGCLVYGASREEARRKVVVLALQIVVDQVEHGEWPDELPAVRFVE